MIGQSPYGDNPSDADAYHLILGTHPIGDRVLDPSFRYQLADDRVHILCRPGVAQGSCQVPHRHLPSVPESLHFRYAELLTRSAGCGRLRDEPRLFHESRILHYGDPEEGALRIGLEDGLRRTVALQRPEGRGDPRPPLLGESAMLQRSPILAFL